MAATRLLKAHPKGDLVLVSVEWYEDRLEEDLYVWICVL
jgi:hypothetical protein